MSQTVYELDSGPDAPIVKFFTGQPDPALLAVANAALFRRYLIIIEGSKSEAQASGAGDVGSVTKIQADVPDEGDTSMANLEWMCRTVLERLDSFPADKASRWLGFVQGVLAVRGLITVAEERDHSRPLFHAAYRAGGIEPPASMQRVAE